MHTTASQCFSDQTITANQWIDKAIESGLNCVGVTDHNTGISIDEIKEAAKGKDITVFPGVEITCDSSKVHLLVIFDPIKTSADIRDFLVRADIPANDFGKKDASTTKSIFEIAELAKHDGAIVIPAHIDEYNGLGSISSTNIERFFKDCDINAVQVVHKDFLNASLEIAGNNELQISINSQHNNPTPKIDEVRIKEWYQPVKAAIKYNKAILTFSDNPNAPHDSKHGLWGIGAHFTWIKMDETPSIEGLRQAFLLPDFRIKNDITNPGIPYTQPELWIKSLTISNTTLTGDTTPFSIEFNPQLNAVIGGRGSGKSSVLRFIRGIFNKTADIQDLKEIIDDQTQFYKKESGRPKKGVLTDTSVIEIDFVRKNVLHKISASNILSPQSQTISIQKLDEAGQWQNVLDAGYIDFFSFDQYSQKQIYEIAQEPNALRERIDEAIPEIEKIQSNREKIKTQFLESAAAVRTATAQLSGKGKLITKIKDLDSNILALQNSGVASLLASIEKYSSQNEVIESIISKIENCANIIDEVSKSIRIDKIDLGQFDISHAREIALSESTMADGISRIEAELSELSSRAIKLKLDFEASINVSQWKMDKDKVTAELVEKRAELEKDGIDDISSFEKHKTEKTALEKELIELDAQESQKASEELKKDELKKKYFSLTKEITEHRRRFIQSTLTGEKVKVLIKPMRNKAEFETRLRKIIQRENTTFQGDVDSLMELCFTGNVEQKLNDFRNVFSIIRSNSGTQTTVSGNFVNLVKGMNDLQIDEIDLAIPEDEIEIQYKPTAASSFKSLSTASAGQKTTAILTFILSYGNLPLILDQPEDDLDNRLVYELIVDRLKQAKDHRQLIVVTHNANIPVNGDAEYIISMDSESKTLKVRHEGTVEKIAIKKEICDVMEGGEIAFEMRSKRYKQLK